MSKDKLIPDLRFSEFKNEGEWKENELNDFCINISSGKDNNSKTGEFELYGSTGIIGKTDIASYNGDYILIARVGANAGLLNRAKGKFGVTDNTLVLDLKIADSIDFIHYSLDKIGLNKLVFGSGQPLITGGQLKSLKLVSPHAKKEQQKIATCLSSLDEVITAHSQKLALLKDHKKGLMQNLFPQEGEKVPKLRFKEFEKDGEWVETRVEKLIQENILFAPKDGNHGNIHPKSSDYVKTGIPFIMASDIKNGKIDFTKCAYLKKEQADSLQKGFAKKGDVLLTHKGTVGEVAFLNELEFPYIMLTPQVTYYRVKEKSKMASIYLAAFFKSDCFQKNLLSVSGGGTRAYVGITEQQKLGIVFSKNIDEQKKVASFLSSLDALINAQAEKIEQLKLHKKGLMQGLFPKIND